MSLLSVLRGCVLVGAALFAWNARAGDAPPAMSVPGQFDVTQTGAASYTIPIVVPPGTAGMVPALALNYSSQSGDGIVGLGFSLGGLPSITRCPRTPAQDNAHVGVHFNANDRFCLEGQRLVSIQAGAGTMEYRTEIDGFSRIVAYGGSSANGPDYFKVWTKSGQIMELGHSADSQVLAAGTTVVRVWAVNRISDTVGNYLTVAYNGATGSDRTANGEVYPVEIDYTGNPGDAQNPAVLPYNRITFTYDFTRQDLIPAYQAGSLQLTNALLISIKTYAGASLVSNYKLDYAPGSAVRHSELTSVRLCSDAAAANCLAPTTFEWQGTKDSLSWPAPVTPPFASGNGFGAVAETGDFNGDGLTDVIPFQASSGACDVWTGTAAGGFAAGGFTAVYDYWYVDPNDPNHTAVHLNGDMCFSDVASGAGPAGAVPVVDIDGDGFADVSFFLLNVTAPGRWFLTNNRARVLGGASVSGIRTGGAWQFADFDGDGRTDYLDAGSSGSQSFFYYSQGDGTFQAGAGQTGLGGVLMSRIPADFDGDGCADVLVQGAGYTPVIRFNCNPATTTVGVQNWVENNYAIAFGDFNGDGKTDVLRSEGGDQAAMFLSWGTMIAPSYTWLHNTNDTDFSKYSIYTGDFNGDGRSDLLLVADGIDFGTVHHYPVGHEHQIWLSTGSGFVYAASIPYSGSAAMDAPTQSFPAIRPIISDWNSDGAMDIMFFKPSGDLLYTPNFTPEYVRTFRNGLGASTAVTYDRLNRNGDVYQKCANGTYDCGDAWPKQDMDGPVFIVTRVDASDGIGGTFTSTYAYGQGAVDLKGRGFLGFGTMKVTDKMGIVQTTRYGAAFPYLGLVVSQTKTCPASVCGSAVTLTTTTNDYEDVPLGTGTDGVARHFVALKQTSVASSDLDGAVLPTITTSYAYDCDALPDPCAAATPAGFGNALGVVQTTAMPNGSDASTKTTTNLFDNDISNGHWYLGRLRTASVTSAAGASTVTRASAFTYDTGGANSTGLLASETVEPNNNSCNGGTMSCTLTTVYAYDHFGNKTGTSTTGIGAVIAGGVQTLASTTRTSAAGFDANGEFARTLTNALSQSESWEYSPAFGLATKHTGPNGQATVFTYDEFGRKKREHRPDGTETQYAYAMCAGSCPANAAFTAQATPTLNDHATQIGPAAISYYDSLYRVVATDVQGFGGKWVRQETQFDAYGRVWRTSRPYFRDDPGVVKYWSTNSAFDKLGRVTLVTQPDGGTSSFVFDGLALSVTQHIVRPDGSATDQTNSTLKNARGLPASVTNALGKSTSYAYDALGNLLRVSDPAGHVSATVYDVRGNKIASSDPDMGAWSYSYDAFGALYRQTDAKGQTATLSYDALGRAVMRRESDLVSRWVFGTDASLFNVGKPLIACTGSGASADCASGAATSRADAYDSKGRPATVTIAAGGAAATYAVTYQAGTGRIATLRYPSGLKLQYAYDASLGYLLSISDTSTGSALWTANARDAEMHLTQSTSGNGVVTFSYFDPRSGLVQQIRASGDGSDDGSLAHVDYGFDTNGSLVGRDDMIADHAHAYTESLCYDALNRLTDAAVGSLGTSDCHAGRVTKAVAYDDLGNITSKSDVGTYQYGASAGPHAVTSITGSVLGVMNPRFRYDANGNLTCEYTGATCGGSGIARETAAWTSFNRVAQISQGTTSVSLSYDDAHARIVQHVADGSTISDTTYLNDPITGAMSEKVVSGTTTWHDYVMADGRMVAEHFKTGVSESWNHFLLDHLGSVAVITGGTRVNGDVVVVGRQSYDAWGRMRNLDGSDDTSCSLPATSITTRGFTGQEQMPAVCLVNLNARLYDPTIARFLSPDSVTEDTYNLQVLNRYSYVGNNPLSFTDPTGNLFGIDDVILAAVVAATLTVAGPLLHIPILGDLAVIASAIACGPLCAGASAATQAGLSGGNIGDIITAFALTAAQAAMMQAIGGPKADESMWGPVHRALEAGMIGGIVSAGSGRGFGSGFLTAGVSSLTAPLAGSVAGQNKIVGTLINAVIGGTISVLGGGKFGNGAVTGAFAYVAGNSGGDARADGEPKGISNDAQANENLDISAESNKITGTVSVSCGSGIIRCGAMIAALNGSNITAGAYTLDLLFVEAGAGETPDLILLGKSLPGNTAANTCCFETKTEVGNTYTVNLNGTITIDFTKFSIKLGDMTHELGHFLGLHHEPNSTDSVMSYSATRSTKFNEDELRRLYNAYHE